MIDKVTVCYVGYAPKIVKENVGVHMAGRKQGERFITFDIHSGFQHRDVGERESVPLYRDATEIAVSQDVINEDDFDRGYFIPKNLSTPTEEELVTAEKRRDAAARLLVDTATNYWRSKRDMREITDEARWCAEWLGVEDEWVGNQRRCPACGRGLTKLAFKCGSCQEIVDIDAYKAHRARMAQVEREIEAETAKPQPTKARL